MPPLPKRDRDIFDSSDDDGFAPQKKQPRLSGASRNPARSSRPQSHANPPSQPSSRTSLPSAIVVDDDDDEVEFIDMTQEDDGPPRERYGTIGIRHGPRLLVYVADALKR